MTREHSRLHTRHNSQWIPIVVSWLSQWVLWLAYVNNVGIREILTGAVVSAVATWAVVDFRRRTEDRYKLRFIYIRQAIHVLRILLNDTWVLCRVVAMRLAGRRTPSGMIAVPFRVGGNGAASRGRRALAITYLTFTPNSLVMGFLPDEQLLFFHTVIPQALPSFMLKMGAKLKKGERTS